MCDKDYIDSIMDSYDSTPDMDSYTDLTDVQGTKIRDCFKNESTLMMKGNLVNFV